MLSNHVLKKAFGDRLDAKPGRVGGCRTPTRGHVNFNSRGGQSSVAKPRAGLSSLHAHGLNYGSVRAAFYNPVARGERGRIASTPSLNVIRKLSQRRRQACAEKLHVVPFVVRVFDDATQPRKASHSVAQISQGLGNVCSRV